MQILEFKVKTPGKKKDSCQKGYPCKSACINRNWKCRNPLEGQAKDFASWLKLQGGKIKTPTESKLVPKQHIQTDKQKVKKLSQKKSPSVKTSKSIDNMSMKELKAIAKEKNIVPSGNKRLLSTWRNALHKADNESNKPSVTKKNESVPTKPKTTKRNNAQLDRNPRNDTRRNGSNVDPKQDKKPTTQTEKTAVVPEKKSSSPRRKAKILLARESLVQQPSKNYLTASMKKNLTDDQQFGVNKAIDSMEKQGGFLNADSTGVGKTRQQLAVADYYAKKGKKVLIVSKAEVLKPKWGKDGNHEISGSFKNDAEAMGIKTSITRGEKPLNKGEIGISTYSNLEVLKNKVDKDTVLILDEAHSFKNAGSARTEAGMKMLEKADKVMYATATPADKPSHLDYLYRSGIFNNNTRDSVYSWLGMSRMGVKKNKDGTAIPLYGVKKGKTDEETAAKLEQINHRIGGLFDSLAANGGTIKREISMEGLDINFKNVKLTDKQRREIQKVADIAETSLDNNAGVKLMAMRRILEPMKVNATSDLTMQRIKEGKQVVIFASRVNDTRVKNELDEKGKTPEEIEGIRSRKKAILEDKAQNLAASDSSLTLSQARQRVQEDLDNAIARGEDPFSDIESAGTTKLLKEKLLSLGLKEADIAEIHGNAKGSGADNMARFQSGQAKVVIATIESGGTGINLDDTTGDKPRSMIIMTPPFSAVENVQAVGRIWRRNTQSNAEVDYMFTDTDVDEWNKKIIGNKMQSLGASVKGEVRKLDISGNQDGSGNLGEAPMLPQGDRKNFKAGDRISDVYDLVQFENLKKMETKSFLKDMRKSVNKLSPEAQSLAQAIFRGNPLDDSGDILSSKKKVTRIGKYGFKIGKQEMANRESQIEELKNLGLIKLRKDKTRVDNISQSNGFEIDSDLFNWMKSKGGEGFFDSEWDENMTEETYLKRKKSREQRRSSLLNFL